MHVVEWSNPRESGSIPGTENAEAAEQRGVNYETGGHDTVLQKRGEGLARKCLTSHPEAKKMNNNDVYDLAGRS
jgi:hypothetical protein